MKNWIWTAVFTISIQFSSKSNVRLRNGISVWFIQRVELNLKFNSWLQITWTIDNEPRQMKQIIVSSIMARFCSKTTTFLLLVIKMSPSIFGIVSFSSKIFRLLFLCAYIRGTYASLRIYKMRLFNFRHLYADLKCFFWIHNSKKQLFNMFYFTLRGNMVHSYDHFTLTKLAHLKIKIPGQNQQ